MDLYTSLVRLKQAMNGGQVPPMTPVPERVRHLIDPAFTIGMGALEEDDHKGLRCPIRGCGTYHHNLGLHIWHRHRALGGCAAVRTALDIPASAAFLSRSLRERTRIATVAGLRRSGYRANNGHYLRGHHAEGARAGNAVRKSVNAANLGDRCTAQVAHRIIDLEHKIGRSPSRREFSDAYGAALLGSVIRAFGTWNSALAQCGLKVRMRSNRRRSREAVLDCLAAWHKVHGDLPSTWEANNRDSTPVIPTIKVIKAAFDADSWPEAMYRAAALLDIRGGRYGLPAKKEA